MADVVQRKFSPGTFRGKIVIIGATATGIGDIKSTPYGVTDYPGVEIHANVIDNLLHGNFLKRGAHQQLLRRSADFAFWASRLASFMALVAPRFMYFGLRY